MNMPFFIFGLVFLFGTRIGLCENTQLDQIVFIKTVKDVKFSQNPVFHRDTLSVLCSIYPMLGSFDVCENIGWKGYHIVDYRKMAKNVILLDLPSHFVADKKENFDEYPHAYLYDDGKMDHECSRKDKNKLPCISLQNAGISGVLDSSYPYKHKEIDGSRIELSKIGRLSKEEISDKIESSAYFATMFIIDNIETIKQKHGLAADAPTVFYYKPEENALKGEDELKKLNLLAELESSEIAVVFRIRQVVSDDLILSSLVKKYSDNACSVKDSEISCDRVIPSEHLSNLCELKQLELINNLNDICDKPRHEKGFGVNTRASANNPHNLYTLGEYTSNYASIFNICAFSFALVVVGFIIGITMMMEIDTSAFSILNKDTSQKLKTE